jgi:hypothetical protein
MAFVLFDHISELFEIIQFFLAFVPEVCQSFVPKGKC